MTNTTETRKGQVQVTKTAFAEAVNNKMNKEAIAKHFGISKAAVAKFAKELGLKVSITRSGSSKYILVDELDAAQVESDSKYSVDALNSELANS